MPISFHASIALAACLTAIAAVTPTSIAQDKTIGQTEVLPWHAGRKASLVLMFDDGMEVQMNNAVPELTKRGLIGTFYPNPGSGQFSAHKAFWAEELPKLGHEYGVHTMTHKVAGDDKARWEIGECTRIIRQINPASTTSPLLSYARPGGEGAFMASDAVERDLLNEYHLIERSQGATQLMYLGQDLKTLNAWVDELIRTGQSGRICFHGVGGQWISIDLPIFTAFLDHLVARKDDLWIAGCIRVYKYTAERQAAQVTLRSADANAIVLQFSTTADPKLYDEPLTLRTRVPATWKQCTITQGSNRSTYPVTEGQVQYDALPSSEEIRIEPR